MHRIHAAALSAVIALASLAQGSEYVIDTPHSNAQFSVRHLMISNVKGEFNKVTGRVSFDAKNMAQANIEAIIDTATVNTRDENRDKHLKSPDFFDVAKFPAMTFKSTKFTPAGANKYKVAGNLTIHGVTKPVVLDVEVTQEIKDPWGKTRIGASGSTKINRGDYGLTWNKALEAGGVMVGEEIAISLDVELVKSTT
jgi:polyisoprenoid-binding protein YceI